MLCVILALFFGTSAFVRADETGCDVDGITVAIGEQYDYPGYCGLNVCKGNNEWTQMACGLVGTPAGWTFVPEDPSKGYPDCCAKALPP